MTLHRFRSLLDRVEFRPFSFKVAREGTACFLRVEYHGGRCNVTGEALSWKGRKWRLSTHMTDGEVVQTAFLAVMTALEHETRECFKFDGVSVFDPHYDIHKLVDLRRRSGALAERPHD